MASTDAQAAVSSLSSFDDAKLYEELGLRLKAISRTPDRSGDFALELTPSDIGTLGLKEDFHAFGQRFFQRVSEQAYPLICGADPEDRQEREKLKTSLGLGKESFAAAVAGLLVAQLGLAPAIATVVALLVIRLFFRPGLEAMCDVWHDKLHHA